MDIRSIRKLIEVIEESQISEIEIKEGESTIRIVKPQSNLNSSVATASSPLSQVVSPAREQTLTDTNANTNSKSRKNIISGKEVVSPMVGTFYSAPSPESGDFVTIGQKIKQGDTLCIIEAMKIMNTIESEISGVVTDILVNNAEPVEFGQTLFVIE